MITHKHNYIEWNKPEFNSYGDGVINRCHRNVVQKREILLSDDEVNKCSLSLQEATSKSRINDWRVVKSCLLHVIMACIQ